MQIDLWESIIIVPDLLNEVCVLSLEEVDPVSFNNGNSFSTYFIPGEPRKREICPNGRAILLS